MKCGKCGWDNPTNLQSCENCGAPIGASQGSRAIDERAWEFERDIDEMNNAQSKGGRRDDYDDEDIDELERQFSSDIDDWESERTQKPKTGRRSAPAARAGGVAHRNSALNNTNEHKQQTDTPRQRRSERYDDDFEELPAGNLRPIEKRAPKRSGGNASRIAIIAVCIAIVAIIGVIAVILAKGDIGPGQTKRAETMLNPNSVGKYLVIIRDVEGAVIAFEDSAGYRTEQTVSSRQNVTFNVSEDALLPIEPIEGTTVEVKPKVFKIESDGTETQIETEPITIAVPAIALSFLTNESFESNDGAVTIAGSVPTSQRGVNITVNGEQVEVGEDGSFKYSKKYDKGEYTLELVATLGGHTTFRKTFRATVNQALTADQVVVIPKSFVTRALNVETSIRVNGTVPVGASITVTSTDSEFSLKSEPTVDETGKFTFEINLPKAAKAYWFTIVATLADGSVFERPFCVERPPVYNEYVPTVWLGTYDEMMKPVHLTDMRGFKIVGTIEQIISNDDYLLATLRLEDGHTVEIEYHNHYSGASTLEEGAQRTMYGYSLGTTGTNGILRLFIWFVQD